jgi:hypothetical protein
MPGWHIEAIDAVNFLAPFKFYRNKPRSLTIEATFHPVEGAVLADCRLLGYRTTKKQAEPEVTTHFTACVRLTQQPPASSVAPAIQARTDQTIVAADIYRVYFHGPAYQVLERAWKAGAQVIGQMPQSLPVHHSPSERPLLVSPRLIELCFQTAGIWEMGVRERMGLPQLIEQVRFWRTPESADGQLYAVVTPNPESGSFDAEVVDAAGNRYLQLTGYRTVALPNSLKAEELKAMHAIA